ncbi:hypothetical protein CLOM_g9073 [Closterium sp. NIES-68]|nr:hypothetical protein CLOM_g9073 [Closterium sp. NIES-68]GJP86840.1 hypothetical protein CLOP_g16815 [Closterium sp. NIES-67]
MLQYAVDYAICRCAAAAAAADADLAPIENCHVAKAARVSEDAERCRGTAGPAAEGDEGGSAGTRTGMAGSAERGGEAPPSMAAAAAAAESTRNPQSTGLGGARISSLQVGSPGNSPERESSSRTLDSPRAASHVSGSDRSGTLVAELDDRASSNAASRATSYRRSATLGAMDLHRIIAATGGRRLRATTGSDQERGGSDKERGGSDKERGTDRNQSGRDTGESGRERGGSDKETSDVSSVTVEVRQSKEFSLAALDSRTRTSSGGNKNSCSSATTVSGTSYTPTGSSDSSSCSSGMYSSGFLDEGTGRFGYASRNKDNTCKNDAFFVNSKKGKSDSDVMKGRKQGGCNKNVEEQEKGRKGWIVRHSDQAGGEGRGEGKGEVAGSAKQAGLRSPHSPLHGIFRLVLNSSCFTPHEERFTSGGKEAEAAEQGTAKGTRKGIGRTGGCLGGWNRGFVAGSGKETEFEDSSLKNSEEEGGGEAASGHGGAEASKGVIQDLQQQQQQHKPQQQQQQQQDVTDTCSQDVFSFLRDPRLTSTVPKEGAAWNTYDSSTGATASDRYSSRDATVADRYSSRGAPTPDARLYSSSPPHTSLRVDVPGEGAICVREGLADSDRAMEGDSTRCRQPDQQEKRHLISHPASAPATPTEAAKPVLLCRDPTLSDRLAPCGGDGGQQQQERHSPSAPASAPSSPTRDPAAPTAAAKPVLLPRGPTLSDHLPLCHGEGGRQRDEGMHEGVVGTDGGERTQGLVQGGFQAVQQVQQQQQQQQQHQHHHHHQQQQGQKQQQQQQQQGRRKGMTRCVSMGIPKLSASFSHIPHLSNFDWTADAAVSAADADASAIAAASDDAAADFGAAGAAGFAGAAAGGLGAGSTTAVHVPSVSFSSHRGVSMRELPGATHSHGFKRALGKSSSYETGSTVSNRGAGASLTSLTAHAEVVAGVMQNNPHAVHGFKRALGKSSSYETGSTASNRGSGAPLSSLTAHAEVVAGVPRNIPHAGHAPKRALGKSSSYETGSAGASRVVGTPAASLKSLTAYAEVVAGVPPTGRAGFVAAAVSQEFTSRKFTHDALAHEEETRTDEDLFPALAETDTGVSPPPPSQPSPFLAAIISSSPGSCLLTSTHSHSLSSVKPPTPSLTIASPSWQPEPPSRQLSRSRSSNSAAAAARASPSPRLLPSPSTLSARKRAGAISSATPPYVVAQKSDAATRKDDALTQNKDALVVRREEGAGRLFDVEEGEEDEEQPVFGSSGKSRSLTHRRRASLPLLPLPAHV